MKMFPKDYMLVKECGVMRILIIGCGSIGSVLAKTVHEISEVDRIYITDQKKDFAVHLMDSLNKTSFIDLSEMDNVLAEVDLVVEAASQDAAKKYIPQILKNGTDVMMMSVGAFSDESFKDECFELAKNNNARIYIPSGAVCGTDGIHAASSGMFDEVRLITTKGPKSLKGAPGITESKINLDALTEPTVVFDGAAKDAVDKFPKNINVAATISLLGVGFEDTRVTIICDPNTSKNSHVLIAKGNFGEMRCEVNNVPSPMNPATSYLAALSAASSIKRILGNVWIGI